MYTDELHGGRLAALVHEINRALQAAHGDEAPSLPWPCEDPAQQWVTIRGVRRVLGHPGITPAEHHDGWREDKAALGWRYGPVKDPVALTHPCMVPWPELPRYQQAKDRVSIAIVRELAA